MPRYLNSTHQKHWMFSKTQLEEICETKQKQLLQNISDSSSDPSLQRYVILPEEEKAIIYFLSKNIITACKHLHVHEKAISTALAYFKRFYLYNSVCEYDPVQMMFTCMFLSCKTEEINIKDVHLFCQQFKESDPKAVLQLEFALISGIKFHLYVFSPKKSLKAILSTVDTSLFTQEEILECERKADEFIDAILISDACFLYNPSEISMAGFYYSLESKVDRENIFFNLFEKLNKKFEENKNVLENIVAEYAKFNEEFARINEFSRAALKKAGSLRHRLKKIKKV
jgi:cyclin H